MGSPYFTREGGTDISFFCRQNKEYDSLGIEIEELMRELDVEGRE